MIPHEALPDPVGIADRLRNLSTSWGGVGTETKLIREGAIPLLLDLGYSQDEIFFDYSIPWLNDFYRVDLAVAPYRNSSPWLLVGVKLHGALEDFVRGLDLLSGLGRACDARAVMYLTQHNISVATAGDRARETHRRLDAITPEWAKELIGEVGRGALVALDDRAKAPYFALALQNNASGRFFIDRKRLEELLAVACVATDSIMKGTSFEVLAEYIIAGLSGVEIRKKNLLTATGELDIVCRFNGTAAPDFLLTTADKYFVVECKNWQNPVSAKEIEVFVGKLQKCRSHLGLLFSRNGITGRTGRDAVGNVEAAWRQYGIIVLVITEETIRQVIQGFDFYTICERLYETVRFSER